MHRGCHISRRVCERWDHRRCGSATLVRRSSRSLERARLSALPLSNSPSQCHSEQEDHSYSRMIFAVEEPAFRNDPHCSCGPAPGRNRRVPFNRRCRVIPKTCARTSEEPYFSLRHQFSTEDKLRCVHAIFLIPTLSPIAWSSHAPARPFGMTQTGFL